MKLKIEKDGSVSFRPQPFKRLSFIAFLIFGNVFYLTSNYSFEKKFFLAFASVISILAIIFFYTLIKVSISEKSITLRNVASFKIFYWKNITAFKADAPSFFSLYDEIYFQTPLTKKITENSFPAPLGIKPNELAENLSSLLKKVQQGEILATQDIVNALQKRNLESSHLKQNYYSVKKLPSYSTFYIPGLHYICFYMLAVSIFFTFKKYDSPSMLLFPFLACALCAIPLSLKKNYYYNRETKILYRSLSFFNKHFNWHNAHAENVMIRYYNFIDINPDVYFYSNSNRSIFSIAWTGYAVNAGDMPFIKTFSTLYFAKKFTMQLAKFGLSHDEASDEIPSILTERGWLDTIADCIRLFTRFFLFSVLGIILALSFNLLFLLIYELVLKLIS